MDITRTSSFWRDLKQILDYLDLQASETVALKIADSVDETIAAIADLPDLGSPWESDESRFQGWRFRLVRGFENYLVLYYRDSQRIYVTRVIDGRRNLEALL
jgi:plasmid stabilization system protein ParE